MIGAHTYNKDPCFTRLQPCNNTLELIEFVYCVREGAEKLHTYIYEELFIHFISHGILTACWPLEFCKVWVMVMLSSLCVALTC